MKLTFGQLLENLGCPDSARIVVVDETLPSGKGTYPIVKQSPASFWTFGMRKTKIQAQNRSTVEQFIELVKKRANPAFEPAITKDLEELKLKGNKLTAGKIREVYRDVVASNLTGVRKTACLSKKNSDRILFDATTSQAKVHNVFFQSLRRKKKTENRQSIQHFYAAFVAEWGEERVNRALRKYDINLRRKFNNGQPLTTKTVNKITLGVSDYYVEDLHQAWDRMKQIAQGTMDVSRIPMYEKRQLLAHLKLTTDADLQAALQPLVTAHLNTPYDQLPAEIHDLVTKVALVRGEDLELAFQGKRIEGIIVGYPPLSWKYFFYPKVIEDKERLQLYQTIFSLHERVVPDVIDKAYQELLAKALVKKHMPVGTLIPAPAALAGKNFTAGWYQVNSTIITGRGKYAHHLTQVHKNKEKLPEILLERSTCSIPVMHDAFTTVATDAYPFAPPGYLWRRAGMKEEDEILFNNLDTPIQLIGHSLGGSIAMLIFANRLEKDKDGKVTLRLPDRVIELVTFDSPALKKKDVEAVAAFLSDPANASLAKKISFIHSFSGEDMIPGAGEFHLGVNIPKEVINKISCVVLDALKANASHLKLHPHGRQYYLTRPELDFKEHSTDIADYNKMPWRRTVEIMRKMTGLVIFPPLMVIGFTKRFFLGWRDNPSGIKLVYHKLIGKTYVPKVKVKNYGLLHHTFQSVQVAAAA